MARNKLIYTCYGRRPDSSEFCRSVDEVPCDLESYGESYIIPRVLKGHSRGVKNHYESLR